MKESSKLRTDNISYLVELLEKENLYGFNAYRVAGFLEARLLDAKILNINEDFSYKTTYFRFFVNFKIKENYPQMILRISKEQFNLEKL